jgi:hypothetical protein
MRPDCIALEIAIANIEPSQIDRLSDLWDALDEQGVAVDRRRALDAYGIRCGIAAVQMPAVFRELANDDSPERRSQSLVAHRMIQNGFGEVHPIDVTGIIPSLHWTVVQPNSRQRSGTCGNATCLFELRSYPKGNGTAEIELVPKIRHGAPRPRLLNQHDSFTLQPLPDEVALDELAFGCRLKPGETLIVGPTKPTTGVGKLFLVDGDEQSGLVRLVLIRLAHTQMDDLFSPRKIQSPLATPY